MKNLKEIGRKLDGCLKWIDWLLAPPIFYIFIGFVGLCLYHSKLFDYDLSVFPLNLILKELSVLLLIAGLVGYAVESRSVKRTFSKLLYLHSDYLRGLGVEQKKEFFSKSLRNAYNFSDYGLEDEFAELTTENYLPVFEDRYKSNFFVHRNYKPVNREKFKEGFTIHEERGWRAHYPKKQNGYRSTTSRTFYYSTNLELLNYLNSYDYEARIEKFIGINDTEDNFQVCGNTSFKLLDKAQFLKSYNLILNNDVSQLDFGVTLNHFSNVLSKKIDLKPNCSFKNGCLLMTYYSDGINVGSLEINVLEKSLIFITPIEFGKIEAKTDYRFVERSTFYSYYRESMNLLMDCPTKNVTLNLVFDDLSEDEFLEVGDLVFFAQAGKKPMPLIKTKNHINVKFSGWFFPKHGVSFSYRIIKRN